MKEDIQNYSPTVMFPGTPCMSIYNERWFEFFFDSRFQKYRFSKLSDIDEIYYY